MDGRAFLLVAQRLAQASSEADWRTAAGRAYYTLMLEAREALRRWGFSIPKGDQIHRFVRLRLPYAADSDLRDVSLTLEESGKLRAEADYQIENLVALLLRMTSGKQSSIPTMRLYCSIESTATTSGSPRPSRQSKKPFPDHPDSRGSPCHLSPSRYTEHFRQPCQAVFPLLN
jgi:hypothetical protein